MNDLTSRLSALADEMTDADYVDLRRKVDRTSRRLGYRRAALTAAIAVVAIAGAVVAGNAVLASRPNSGPAPAASPTAGVVTNTPGPEPTSVPPTGTSANAHTAAADVVPGTLSYLKVVRGQPIELTRVTDGTVHRSTFGTATVSDEYVAAPSPDGTKIALIESPDPGSVKPGDLVVVVAGGAWRTLAHNITWGGGSWPTWAPDSNSIVVKSGSGYVTVDLATGTTTAPPKLSGSVDYLTWSGTGAWLAYAASGQEIVVSRPDGTGLGRASITGLPECHEFAACPFAVQAVSDDGRYVAIGHGNTDPGHVAEAHLTLDMRTGRLASLPKVTGAIDKIYFRSGGLVLRSGGDSGRYTFSLVDPTGTVTASFPDTHETAGTRLVGYQP